MIALLRFLIVLLILQTIVYVVVTIHLRRRHRERLSMKWEEDNMSGDHEAFLDQGVEDHMGQLRNWLLLLIYVLPVIGVGLVIYLNN